jgi:hypothetical protein
VNEIMVQYVFKKYYEDEGLSFHADDVRDTIAAETCGQAGVYKIKDSISRLAASDVGSLARYLCLDGLC